MKNLKIANKNCNENILVYLAIAFIVIFPSFFLFNIYKTYNNSELVNYDTKLTGKIIKLKDYKGQVYVLFENDSKYWSIDNSYNYDYSPAFLGNFLSKNDSMYKNSCSDTLFIQRENSEYFFIIGDITFNSKDISPIVSERYRPQRRIIKEKGNCMESKNFKLKAEEIEELIPNSGGCFASHKITIDGMKVGYMYREESDFESDSGWRFLSGTESQEYMDNEDNTGIFEVNTIANYDRTIIPYLNLPIGTELVRVDNSDNFEIVEN